MKKNRVGKAAIFEDREIRKIRESFSQFHRAIFEIALFTGERMGAIVQLRVDDVYSDPTTRKLHQEVTFTARTRKARPDGSRETRQIPIQPDLRSFLQSYQPPRCGYLFPGKNGEHITYNAVYDYWSKKFSYLGLDHRGFSTHSTRRWFITQLARNGIDIKTIQAITGHSNINVLMGYVDASPDRIKNAMATLSI